MCLEFLHTGDTLVLLREKVRHKFSLSRVRGVNNRRGEINAGVKIENARDLIQFYSLSADFRLPVEASPKFDLSIRSSNAAIASAIHTGPWCPRDWCSRERIGQKALP